MAKKTIYRTVIKLEILSDEPISDERSSMSLAGIVEECETGSFSGSHDFTIVNQKVSGKKAVSLIQNQGSDPEFFGMDDDGNEIDY